MSGRIRDLQNRQLNEVQLDKSFNFQGSWFEIETGEAVSILYLEGGEQSRMEKIKDTTAASYNLDRNLFLQPKLDPLGAYVILFHLFDTLQS